MSLDKWRCSRCKKPINGDTAFCSSCGWLQDPGGYIDLICSQSQSSSSSSSSASFSTTAKIRTTAINPKSETQSEAPGKSAQVTKPGREGSQEAKTVREGAAPVL